MKITRIEIQNYKAFRDIEPFDIDGKNVLIYGNNGSGKTSFAHALQSLIQSSTKTPEQIQQAFDRTNDESIVNLDTPVDGESFVLLTTDNNDTFKYSINGDTQASQVLLGANQVSDYLNYRVLLRFYSFRNSQSADIFPIFQDEFFSYWTASDQGVTYQDWLNNLEVKLSGLKKDRVRRNSIRYRSFLEQLKDFNTSIQRQIVELIEPANTFLKVYLSTDEPVEVNFRFLRGYEFDSENRFTLLLPIVQMVINYDGKPINHPHAFLNEARLTALGLAIRLAAFEARPRRVSDFKVLVLDDLLISLDMSLRMKVIQALLDSYKDYQFVILTHDKGFYTFLKQKLILEKASWKCFEMYETIRNGKFFKPFVRDGTDCLEKAEKFFNEKEYESCAVYLRKKAEEIVELFYDPSLEALARYKVLGNLSNAIGTISKKYHAQRLGNITAILDSADFSTEMVQKLTREIFRGDETLTQEQLGQINRLRTRIMRFVSDYYAHRDKYIKNKLELEQLCMELNRIRSLVLNPGAHNDGSNLFDNELSTALQTLKTFETKVKILYKKE